MPSETASKRFKTLYFDSYSHTLPSSSESGFTESDSGNRSLYMYNGSHANNSLSSSGSFYSGRVANAMTATEDISIKNYLNNVCAKNWTLPTGIQMDAINGTSYWEYFRQALFGGYRNSNHYWVGNGYWWSRTSYSSTQFRDIVGYGSSKLLSTSNGGRCQWVHTGNSVRCITK